MYTVSNKYKQVIYSGDAKHKLFLYFKGHEVEDANTKVEYVKVKANILSNGEERFSLDNFVSKDVEIKIHDINIEDILEPISISIGTLVDDAYEIVPIGIFNLSEAPTKDGNVTTLKLRDNSVKFDVPYNAEDVIKSQYEITTDTTYQPNKEYFTYDDSTYILLVEGTDYEIGDEITGTVYQRKNYATMLQILQDICDKCEVELETDSFINDDTTVSVWDNSITARQYIMWIAEKAGSIATISRTGALELIQIDDNLVTFDLDANLIESYTESDKFTISRVVYEDAIRKFEYGDLPSPEDVLYPSTTLYPSIELYPTHDWNYLKQYTTLYIGTSNPYITNTEEIEEIYNSIKDFSIYGIKISKILGNPALDPYDLIRFTYKGNTYISFAQSTLTYNGVITQSFETDIGTLEKAQENVTLNTDEARFKKAFTKIDQVEGTIQLHTSEISNISTNVNNVNDNLNKNYYTIEQTENFVADATSGITNTFQTSGGTNIFRNTGLWFETSDSNNPYEFWNGLVAKQKEEKASNMSALILQSGSLYQEQTVPNDNYTVSFKYKKLILLSNPKVYINDIEFSLPEEEDTEFVQTIQVTSQHINIRFSCDINNCCEIYDLMVNVGETNLKYTQNQNETTTDTVNISKGITITSSDIDVTFKANADGIRTLDKNNNELTKFTDAGMDTKEAIIREKSQIVGTLWQEVGSQTWITRL